MQNEVRLDLFEGDPPEQRGWNPGHELTRVAVSLASVEARLADLDAGRARELTLVAADPWQWPSFAALLARLAAERGTTSPVRRIALRCFATALAAADRAPALHAAGIERVVALVAAADGARHVALCRDPAAATDFDAGLAAVGRTGVEAYLGVVVTRSVLSDGAAFPELVARHDLRGLLLVLPPDGPVPPEAHALLASQRETSSFAAAVFDACRRSGKRYGFSPRAGVSPCASDTALDVFGTVFHERARLRRGERPDRVVRVTACAHCALADTCTGVERTEVERFGEAHLEPVDEARVARWKLKRSEIDEPHDYRQASPFQNRGSRSARALVRVNGHCQMACAFCFVDRTAGDLPAAEVRSFVEDVARTQRDHLVFSGGEPTMHPELPALIAHARALGFSAVEIQTNGLACADRTYARRLADAGLTRATVSLHSSDPALSDAVTMLPGAFPKTLAGIHALRAAGVDTQIAIVLSEQSYAALPSTVRWMRAEFPASGGHLSLCLAIAQEISDLVAPWSAPRFADITPYVREALDFCLENDVGFGGMLGQGGFPPCVFGGDLRYYEPNLGARYESDDHDAQFAKGARCAECDFDPVCMGVRRSYVERHGDAELVPFRVDGAARALLEAARTAGRDEPAPRGDLVQLRSKPAA